MGLEPMTSSLPRKCSTTELQQRIARVSIVFFFKKNYLNSAERVKGIEPSPPAWKAGALPLSYTRCSKSVTADRSYRQADRIPKSTHTPMTTSRKTQKTGAFSGLTLQPLSLTEQNLIGAWSNKIRKSGGSRIRTCEGRANRFTVCPVWPLRYPPNQILMLLAFSS